MNNLIISINIGLLLSYVFTYYCHCQIDNYKNDLDDKLLRRYKKINQERMNHFFIGIVVAIVASFVYYSKMPVDTPKMEMVNVVVLFLLLIPMIVYKILPKSDYMLKHNQTRGDYRDWFKIYLCMKNKSISGFLVGFCASMVVLSFLNRSV